MTTTAYGAYHIDADKNGYVIREYSTGRAIHADRQPTACCIPTNTQRALQWLTDRSTFMTPTDYAEQAAKTAVYPKEAVMYPFLGLAGECGEVLAVLSTTPLRPLNRQDLLKEIGDVCWYFAEVCRATGCDFAAAIDMSSFRDIGGISPRDQMPVVVGRICEIAKKTLRDDRGQWTDKRKALLADSLHKLGGVLLALCRFYGISLSDVLAANVEKLMSRLTRDKLHGDGDNR